MGLVQVGLSFLFERKLAHRERQVELGVIAAQVAHDIRAPLAALAASEKDLSALPEDTRVMIRNAVFRVREIAHQLLEKSRPASLSMASEWMVGLIENVLIEKRMQFRNYTDLDIQSEFDAGAYALFVRVQRREFKRVLSNLVNNSAEAMGYRGKVIVRVGLSTQWKTKLEVIDHGKGIKPEILQKLGNRGETYGKMGGCGLGLSHAKQSVQAWRGEFSIDSEIGCGTRVKLNFPRVDAPAWFVSELRIRKGSTVVILDDESVVHRIWRDRLRQEQTKGGDVQLCHFTSAVQLSHWISENEVKSRDALYLIDFELLSSHITGLELVQDLRICSQSVLVTHYYEEPFIQNQCMQFRIRLLPKSFASIIPIQIV